MKTFKAGDKVKVVKKVTEDVFDEFENTWVGSMDAWIGKTLTVKSQSKYGVDVVETWEGFPPAALEIAKTEVVKNVSSFEFMAGDTVRIARETENSELVGGEYNFVAGMKKFLGQNAVVRTVSAQGVLLKDVDYWWPRASLDLVSRPHPNPAVEEIKKIIDTKLQAESIVLRDTGPEVTLRNSAEVAAEILALITR
jgi:hypothetical protein